MRSPTKAQAAGKRRLGKHPSPSTKPRPFVFVLMPFAPKFDDVYRLGIRPACENVGAYAERVDDQLFDGSILQRIYNQIAKADVVVADMSGRNPNVFYETGYAHALGKRVVLLTQRVDDIPFDLKQYPHIIYGGRIVDLLPELEKRLRFLLEYPDESVTPIVAEVEAKLGDILLTGNPLIVIPFQEGRRTLDLRLGLHNSMKREIKSRSFEVAVITPTIFGEAQAGEYGASSLQDGDVVVHAISNEFHLLPGAWKGLRLILITAGDPPLKHPFACAIRLLTTSGFGDVPFRIELVRP